MTVIDNDGKPRVKLLLVTLSVGVVRVSAAAPLGLFFCALSSADPYCHIVALLARIKPLSVNVVVLMAGVPVVSLFRPDLLLLMTISARWPLDSLTAKTSRFASLLIADATVPLGLVIFDASCSPK